MSTSVASSSSPPRPPPSNRVRPSPRPMAPSLAQTPRPTTDIVGSARTRPISSSSSISQDVNYDASFTSTNSISPLFPITPYNTFSQPDSFSYQDRSSHPDQALPSPLSYTSTTTTTTSTMTSDDVPFSTREIPRPPQALHSSSTITSGANTTSIASSSAVPLISNEQPIPTPSSQFSQLSTPPTTTVKFSNLDLFSSNSRVSSKLPKQDDVDAHRLQQLGYDAVLGRDYTFWSSLSISWLNIGALQGTIYAVSGAYSYGGPLMILVAWPLSGIFCVFLTATMSELASAYPVAGAMASWAWKLARGGVGGERGWGWLLGGFVMGGHIGNILLVVWEICNIIAGTMALSFDYERKPWHLFLFFVAILLSCGGVASRPWGRSHRFWLAAGAFGFSMWLVLCVTLLATNATRHRPDTMFNNFYNTTGWTSKPYVYLLGWEFTTIASGADASAHMAEETQNPSRNVPNAMIVAIILAYVSGYVSIVLLLLAVKPEDAVTIKSHAFPFGYILTKAISKSGAVTICSLMVVVLLFQTLAQLQASSRFVFALARDNAMPFSDIVKKTNSHRMPVIANWLVIALCCPFACLTLASQSTLYSVLAVTASTLSYAGYLVPVALYFFSNKDLQSEGRTSWSLRKWSKPVALVGSLYAVFVIISSSFPGSKPVTPDTFSWSPAILVGTALTCLVTWKCYGDRHYSGPIRAVTKWETGVELDLSTTLASSRSRNTGGEDGLEWSQAINRPDSRSRVGADSSLKLDLAYEHPTDSQIENGLVTITSAETGDQVSNAHDQSGEWEEMNSSGSGTGSGETETGSEGSSSSTITRE